jgi:DNA-binding transcriptional LysR family regulator
LVGPPGDALTRRKTVAFSRLQGLPLVLPCRPSAWRDTLDTLAREQGFTLNVVLEADSLLMQRELADAGGYHTILGPLAIAADWQAGRFARVPGDAQEFIPLPGIRA